MIAGSFLGLAAHDLVCLASPAMHEAKFIHGLLSQQFCCAQGISRYRLPFCVAGMGSGKKDSKLDRKSSLKKKDRRRSKRSSTSSESEDSTMVAVKGIGETFGLLLDCMASSGFQLQCHLHVSPGYVCYVMFVCCSP